MKKPHFDQNVSVLPPTSYKANFFQEFQDIFVTGPVSKQTYIIRQQIFILAITVNQTYFDAQINKPPENDIIALEKLGHSKKDIRGFLGGQHLPLIEEVENFGEDMSAALHINRSLIEDTSFLQHGGLVAALVGVRSSYKTNYKLERYSNTC